MTRAAIFDAVKAARGRGWQVSEVADFDAVLDRLGVPVDRVNIEATAKICITAPTVRTLGEIVGHEAIVQEWYLDSERVGTWGVGVTNASGHAVDRYKDNPQPIRKCLEVYFWLLTTKYLPDVLAAFTGHPLTEAQLTAALSFHYNTGAIKRASWVKSVLAGNLAEARIEIMEWRSPAAIIERRQKERDLFFDGVWSGDGKATVYQVHKPSYTPNWGSAKRVDITADLAAIAGGSA